MSRLTRGRAMLLLLAALALLIAWDAGTGRPPDRFAAPKPLALWSGQAASGGWCTSPGR